MKSVDRIVTGTYSTIRQWRNPDSGIWEIFEESGIPLTIANRNPRSTDKESQVQYLNPESKTVLDSLTRGNSAT